MSNKRPFRIFVGETHTTSDGARHRATAREYAFAEDGGGRVVPVALQGQVESRLFQQGPRAWAEMEGRVRKLCEASGAGSKVFWNTAAMVLYFNSVKGEERDVLRISRAGGESRQTGRVWNMPASWGEAFLCGEAALEAFESRRAGGDAEGVHVLRDERGGTLLVVGMRDAELVWSSPEGFEEIFTQDVRALQAALKPVDETVETSSRAAFPR